MNVEGALRQRGDGLVWEAVDKVAGSTWIESDEEKSKVSL